MEEVLGAASLLLNGGGLDQVQTISRELHTALDSDEVDTRRFLRELTGFITTLDQQRERIVRIMATQPAVRHDQRRRAGRRARPRRPRTRPAGAGGAARAAGTDAELASRFGKVSTRVIRESGDALVADLEALEPIARALRKPGKALPESIEAILSFPFPDEVLTAARGDYVNLAVEMDLTPLTLLGNTTGTNEEPGGGTGLPGPDLPSDPLGLAGLLGERRQR